MMTSIRPSPDGHGAARTEREPIPRLSLHTVCTRPWDGMQCVRHYAAAGIAGITFWRFNFDRHSPSDLGRLAREEGLTVTGLARGGFFPAPDEAGRRRAIEENLVAIDQAHACGAPVLVLVCGAVPGLPLAEARGQIRDGIAACLAHASDAGVTLAIEPLHPMYADDRSAVNTMRQANDLCRELGDPGSLGIACDVYHTWWDPELEPEIRTAGGRGRLAAFHLCDWLTPTRDLLDDRGIMGEGCIDIRGIAGWITQAGFDGPHEVEIFSTRHWAREQDIVLREIIAAYHAHFPPEGPSPAT